MRVDRSIRRRAHTRRIGGGSTKVKRSSPFLLKTMRAGTMDGVARSIGYDKTTEVPRSKIKELAKGMIESYGGQRATGMSGIQTKLRKNMNTRNAHFFRALDDEVRHQIRRTPGWK